MKRELTHRPLRFATYEGYDQLPERDRNFVVDRAVEEYSINEPIGSAHDDDGAPSVGFVDARTARAVGQGARGGRVLSSDDLREDALRRENAAQRENIATNPFRDEPHPAMVTAVKRFGIVGLIAGALVSAALRWWKVLAR
jgi:hypothetical protein